MYETLMEKFICEKKFWFSWICLNFLCEFLYLYEILANSFL